MSVELLRARRKAFDGAFFALIQGMRFFLAELKALNFTLLLFSSQWLWAGDWHEQLPLLEAREKAEFFLKVNVLIPSLTEGASRYAFDPVTLLNHQIATQKINEKNTDYQRLEPLHRELIAMHVFSAVDEASNSSLQLQDKTKKWNEFVQRATQFTIEHKDQFPSLSTLIDSPLIGKEQSLTTGLASFVPADKKKEYFAAPLSEKLKILEQVLPGEIVAHGFQPSKLGWADTSISKTEILLRLKQANFLTTLLTSKLIADFTASKSTDFKLQLESDTELSVEQKKKLENYFISNVSKLIPKMTSQEGVRLRLKMTEVPPQVAIFRGFAGNDCSTLCSFPFVNSPNEYTFLVYDNKESIKGYVQATVVHSEGERMLYIHTIAGPRISSDDTAIILNSFSQIKEKYGWKAIVIPPLEKISAYVNFIPVKETFKKTITSETRAISYEDSNYRSLLKTSFQLSKSYDDADSNKIAHTIDIEAIKTSTRVEIGSTNHLTEIRSQMTREKALLILITLAKSWSSNMTMITEIGKLTDIRLSDVQELKNAAQNLTKLEPSKLIQNFSDLLEKKGFHFQQGYFQKDISLLATGILNSAELPQTSPYLMDALQTLINQKDFAGLQAFLLRRPEILRNSKLALDVLKNYYRDIHEAEFKEPILLQKALSINAKAILNDEDTLEILRGSSKTAAVIFSHLLRNRTQVTSLSRGEAGTQFAHSLRRTWWAMESTIAKMKKSKTDAEYEELRQTLRRDLLNSMPDADANLIEGQVLTLTQDQLALVAKENVTLYMSKLVSVGTSESQSVIRKLLVPALQHSPIGSLYVPLGALDKTISKLPDASLERDYWIKAAAEAISLREDRNEVKKLFGSKFLFLNWPKITAIRCQQVLTSGQAISKQ